MQCVKLWLTAINPTQLLIDSFLFHCILFQLLYFVSSCPNTPGYNSRGSAVSYVLVT